MNKMYRIGHMTFEPAAVEADRERARYLCVRNRRILYQLSRFQLIVRRRRLARPRTRYEKRVAASDAGIVGRDRFEAPYL